MAHHHINLTNPIAMQPLPAALIQHASRSQTPQGQRSHTQTPQPQQQQLKDGSSTAIEAIDPQSEDHADAVRRFPSSAASKDVERGPLYDSQNDPYALSGSLKPEEEIGSFGTSLFRRNSGGTGAKEAIKAHKIRNFYTEQNENIARLLKPIEDHRREAKEENDSNALQYKIAVNASFAANILLAILQLYGAISSGSLSLVTTLADALFDPLSNILLIVTHRAVNKVDSRKYPSGKARIENAGNITFCFLMFSVSVVIIVFSIVSLVQGNGGARTEKFSLPSYIVVAIAFTTKLSLFLYCWALRNKYSQVRILWEDHRNDIIINGAGLATSILGSRVYWAIDPAGAIVLSLIIAGLWLTTAVKEFKLLIGVSADPSYLQLITYICKYHRLVCNCRQRLLTCLSHDPLSPYHRPRHCARMVLGTATRRRG